MMMLPCEYCGYPAPHDIEGNTDHVCSTGPMSDLVASFLPKPKGDTVIVAETTAKGHGNTFYDQWRNDD